MRNASNRHARSEFGTTIFAPLTLRPAGMRNPAHIRSDAVFAGLALLIVLTCGGPYAAVGGGLDPNTPPPMPHAMALPAQPIVDGENDRPPRLFAGKRRRHANRSIHLLYPN